MENYAERFLKAYNQLDYTIKKKRSNNSKNTFV